jgi:hypothetical protein
MICPFCQKDISIREFSNGEYFCSCSYSLNYRIKKNRIKYFSLIIDNETIAYKSTKRNIRIFDGSNPINQKWITILDDFEPNNFTINDLFQEVERIYTRWKQLKNFL